MTITSIDNIQSSLASLQENLLTPHQYLKENFTTSLGYKVMRQESYGTTPKPS